ncbi:bifunctional proline dehydrogenase/L-glutamate gamma-semialdehyde dehydrogenase [Xylanimonas protaetiae]|uniref:L-glutamate gamma-semialdehyde dehydrogenase n=1 Tax=Xylanimonas protaetiae TaxID=2509457 RepID=A0A4P6F6U3_9MICO|nr:bifunctional proline dehydrogenase/L-glutamate gamma-semialdehyde dehydrogenase [Xylanimonas protaetiae]QAY68947.1 aldehyde dehydrogenase family protein [Xylanimonas protaetiae]
MAVTKQDVELAHLVDDAVALAGRWAAASGADRRAARDAARLGRLVADPAGLELAVRFVDDVARPQDVRVAAKALAALGASAGDALGTRAGAASFLGRGDRLLLRAGARLAPRLPQVVVPAARARLRQLVGHLVADAGPGLGRHLARTRAQGFALNVNLLGEAVLGEEEARARLARTVALVERPDVDYVSVKVSSVAAQLVTWDLEGSRERVVARLLPLYRAAQEHGVFLNLDMEEYRDLALTTAVFQDVLGRDELRGLEAGIVLQAYLPDALGALDELTAFAAERVARGGARVKVRLVKGANLAMEHVEAELHGWAPAPYDTKPAVDANYLRILDAALTPGRTRAVRLGVASHNLFDLALAVLVARGRDVMEALDLEMLQGMAPAEAHAVRDEVTPHGGRVVLYTPVVRPQDFDVAISYLVRRLEENAAPQNFLHAVTALGAGAMAAQETAFRASVAAAVPYTPADVAPRRHPHPQPPPTPANHGRATLDVRDTPPNSGHSGSLDGGFRGFSNAVDIDPALAVNRAFARRILDRAASGFVPVKAAPLGTTAAVDDAVARAVEVQRAWAAVPPAARAAGLDAVGARLEERRADLVAAMVHEAGKTVAEADPEVSEAVDFAHYYSRSARALDDVPGARFTPDGVTLVTPPWNFPVAIPAGGVLAALAAGSVVLAKPASPTPRCFELAIEAIHAGLLDAAAATGLTPGQSRHLVQFLRVHDRGVARHLVTHDDVARVILTGSIETAELFAGWKPERPVLAETSGKNAIVVTPSADLDLAVADLVRSAFGHAGQKCSAASLAILVGPVGDPSTPTGERFRRQLVDAVRSLRVGPATDLATVMGPLTEPAAGKLERALTTLEDGETWLVRPRRLDAEAAAAGLDPQRLWTPGLREGVAPGSFFHLTEVFGPVLGLMTADDLDAAIALQNGVAFGLTAGLHSLDDDEVATWCDRVEAGNLYVNRHITGAVVRRQPFGGWKASSVGPGAKAGGPHYVAQLGAWSDAADVPSRTADPAAWLAWAEADDERAWAHLAAGHDPSGLRAEENTFRMRPVDRVTVRVGDGALPVEVSRVLAAARRAGVPAVVVPAADHGWGVPHEAPASDADFAAAVASGQVGGRIRVVGAAPGLRAAAAAHPGTTTVLDAPVVASGERELLAFLREQAVSRTRHRYGHVRR